MQTPSDMLYNMEPTITTLGIDPSLTSTGVVLLDGTNIARSGIAKTTSTQNLGTRYRIILETILDIAGDTTIHTAAVENPSHGRNPKIANLLGGAWGVSLLACAQLGLDPHIVRPTEHRAPWGAQKKAQAVALVRARWPELENKPDDLADAASVAWLARLRLLEALKTEG